MFLSRPISFASLNKLESTPVSGKIGIFFFPNAIFNELSIKSGEKINGDNANDTRLLEIL